MDRSRIAVRVQHLVMCSFQGAASRWPIPKTQNTIHLPKNAMSRPGGDWDLVHGELMTFANPGFDLPTIDRLEAFDPNGRCVYKRVLVVLDVYSEVTLCWTYKYEATNNGERTNGNWKVYFESVRIDFAA